MAKPVINNLEIVQRDHGLQPGDGIGSIHWDDGAFRYHFWTRLDAITPDTRRQRSTGRKIAVIYKNSLDRAKATLHPRYCDADSAAWSPVVAEIKRRIEAEGLVAKAIAAKKAEHEKEEADRLEAAHKAKIAKVFGTHGEKLCDLLGIALACMASAAADERRGADSQAYWNRRYLEASAAVDAARTALEESEG